MLRKRKAHKTARRLDTGDKQSQVPCPFCAVQQPENVVHESTHMLVIKNRVPYDYFEGTAVLNHLMVVPKKHRRSLAEFTEEEMLDYVRTIAWYEAADYSIYSRGVVNKIRSVEHVHTHVLQTPHKRARFVMYLVRPYINIHLK
jgi:diadenosine tetraphosphate (Ap4A) HIT family hydrolase